MTDRSADVLPPVVPFAELHAKSAFSFLRATATPEALVARAVELGLRGLALVDEGSLSGAVRFIRASVSCSIHWFRAATPPAASEVPTMTASSSTTRNGGRAAR